MPSLDEHQSLNTVKVLLMGDTGAGKTGSLVSLAAAGYNLRILDFDNGLDILRNVARDPKYPKGMLNNIRFVTLTDKMKSFGGKAVPVKATVFSRAMDMCDKWIERGPAPPRVEGQPAEKGAILCDLGPITTWTDQDVLVIDSLTFLSNAALQFAMQMDAKLGQRPEQQHWYQAQTLIEGFLQMIYDENVKCNVVMLAHIAYQGEENMPQKGFPNSAGKALGPKIGRYFNSAIMAKTIGSGASERRVLSTKSTSIVELKTSAPRNVKETYPIETGLAEFFKDIRGAK